MITYEFSVIIIISFFLFSSLILMVKKRISFLKFFYLMLFAVYISSVIAITIFPIPVQKELLKDPFLAVKNNFIPFYSFIIFFNKDFMEYGIFIVIKQIIGNIILFAPLSFILCILFPITKIKNILFVCFCASLGIEIIQGILGFILGCNYRSVDIDDIIFNFIGSIIGILIFKVFYKFLKKRNLLLES